MSNKNFLCQDRIDNILMPAPDNVQQNYEKLQYMTKSRGYKSYETRACYIMLCINNPEHLSSLQSFRLKVIHYIKTNYTFLPKFDSDKLWNSRNGLEFISITP